MRNRHNCIIAFLDELCKAQCPTTPTADADLVNLSYLNSFGYTKGPKVKHLLWGRPFIYPTTADNPSTADKDTGWVDKTFTSYTAPSKLLNRGTWSNADGWSFNWSVGRSYDMNYLLIANSNSEAKLSDYDAIMHIYGSGDTIGRPNITIFPVWLLKMHCERLSRWYSDYSLRGQDYNYQRSLNLTNSINYHFDCVFDFLFGGNGERIFGVAENIYTNSIWGLKF